MSARERITKLEALLDRVKTRAAMPRVVAQAAVARPVVQTAPPPTARPLTPIPEPIAPPAVEPEPIAEPFEAPIPTVPPTPEARALEVDMRTPPPPHVDESRTRVAEPHAAEPQDSIVEIDESDLIADPIVQEEEKPPPSSKRPIPMEQIAEAQRDEPPPPPPPESGKLVAAVPAFDDDFTGVREASHQLPALSPDEPAIEVQIVEPPKVEPPHEMEAELSPPPVAEPERISEVQPITLEPEVTKPQMPSAKPAQLRGDVATFKPATFGQLLDATLDL